MAAATEQTGSCNQELFNPIISLGWQYSLILVISHILQILLRPLGQASPIVQILVSMSYLHTVFFTNTWCALSQMCRILKLGILDKKWRGEKD